MNPTGQQANGSAAAKWGSFAGRGGGQAAAPAVVTPALDDLPSLPGLGDDTTGPQAPKMWGVSTDKTAKKKDTKGKEPVKGPIKVVAPAAKVATPTTKQNSNGDNWGTAIPGELHPCLRIYGSCTTKPHCRFSEEPSECCVRYLKGVCTSQYDDRCRLGKHTQKSGEPILSREDEEDRQRAKREAAQSFAKKEQQEKQQPPKETKPVAAAPVVEEKKAPAPAAPALSESEEDDEGYEDEEDDNAPSTPTNGDNTHPCIRLFGRCTHKGTCRFVNAPYDACLNSLKGRCPSKNCKKGVHYDDPESVGVATPKKDSPKKSPESTNKDEDTSPVTSPTSPAAPTPTKAIPEGGRLHPCKRLFGTCGKGARCRFADAPYDACLSNLKGNCPNSDAKCKKGVHYGKWGGSAEDKQQASGGDKKDKKKEASKKDTKEEVGKKGKKEKEELVDEYYNYRREKPAADSGIKLHPCLRLFKSCWNKGACRFKTEPYDACLNDCKGQCKLSVNKSGRCDKGVHYLQKDREPSVAADDTASTSSAEEEDWEEEDEEEEYYDDEMESDEEGSDKKLHPCLRFYGKCGTGNCRFAAYPYDACLWYLKGKCTNQDKVGRCKTGVHYTAPDSETTSPNESPKKAPKKETSAATPEKPKQAEKGPPLFVRLLKEQCPQSGSSQSSKKQQQAAKTTYSVEVTSKIRVHKNQDALEEAEGAGKSSKHKTFSHSLTLDAKGDPCESVITDFDSPLLENFFDEGNQTFKFRQTSGRQALIKKALEVGAAFGKVTQSKGGRKVELPVRLCYDRIGDQGAGIAQVTLQQPNGSGNAVGRINIQGFTDLMPVDDVPKGDDAALKNALGELREESAPEQEDGPAEAAPTEKHHQDPTTNSWAQKAAAPVAGGNAWGAQRGTPPAATALEQNPFLTGSSTKKSNPDGVTCACCGANENTGFIQNNMSHRCWAEEQLEIRQRETSRRGMSFDDDEDDVLQLTKPPSDHQFVTCSAKYRYCSTECQIDHWKFTHKPTCELLSQLEDQTSQFSGLAALRGEAPMAVEQDAFFQSPVQQGPPSPFYQQPAPLMQQQLHQQMPLGGFGGFQQPPPLQSPGSQDGTEGTPKKVLKLMCVRQS